MEELLGILILRWGTAAAGLIVAIVALSRASRRIDVPNQVLAELALLKAKLNSVTTSVEQMVGAFEDRFTRFQKGIAGQQGGRGNRRPDREVTDVDLEKRADTRLPLRGPSILDKPSQAQLRSAIGQARQDKERTG